jgi:hypothetical protein
MTVPFYINPTVVKSEITAAERSWFRSRVQETTSLVAIRRASF